MGPHSYFNNCTVC